MARAILLALAVSTALALPPSAEAAATRYAAPNGSELSGCTSDQPCSINRALANAGPDDDVIVRTGDYGSVMAPLTVPAVGSQPGLKVHGEDGKPRPRIYGFTADDTSVLDVTGAGATVRHLEVHQLSGGSRQGAFAFNGDDASDLIVTNSASQGKACIVQGTSVLKDSLCLAAGNNGFGVTSWRNQGAAGATNATLRNVTAIAPGTGATHNGTGIQALAGNGMGDDHHFTVTNTIARGGYVDVAADNLPGGQGTATMTLDHSNFGFQSQLPVGSGTGRITDGPGGGNQKFVPVAFAAPGDYHEAPGAATIDKGATDPLNGTIDIDGDLRTLGQGTDIGADEFVPPPVATTGAAGAVTRSSALVNGTVNPERLATTYHFDYGASNAYGASTPAADAGAGTADVPVSTTLTGLAAGTTYHYRLVATNAGGTTFGADMKVTTQSAGGGPGGGAGAHFIGPLVLANKSFAAAASGPSVRAAAKRKPPIGTKVTYVLDAATTVGFGVERAASGRRSGKRCVKPTKKNRKARKCTRYVRLKGGFLQVVATGQHSFRFTGRLNGKKLAVGRYRLVAVARNSAGKTSDTRRASFTIVRR